MKLLVIAAVGHLKFVDNFLDSKTEATFFLWDFNCPSLAAAGNTPPLPGVACLKMTSFTLRV